MPRKYKMPRTFKSPETYQKWLEGKVKSGSAPKTITSETREKLREGGKITCQHRWGKITVVAEDNEKYTT